MQGTISNVSLFIVLFLYLFANSLTKGFPISFVRRCEKARVNDLKKLSVKGNGCAQYLLATHYFGGNFTKMNKKQALKLLRASEDAHPGSAHLLAQYHKTGDCGIEKSDVKVRSLSKKSADAGDMTAREEYASMCWWGTGGEEDRVTAAWYASLVCNDKRRKGSKPKHIQYQSAEWVLGSLFQYGEGGMEQSLYLARHYLSIAVEREDPFAHFQLAHVNVIMSKLHYDGNIFIPGFSPVPKALNWARKAFSEEGLFLDDKQATEGPRAFVAELEMEVKKCCANCNKLSGKNNKLMGCVR